MLSQPAVPLLPACQSFIPLTKNSIDILFIMLSNAAPSINRLKGLCLSPQPSLDPVRVMFKRITVRMRHLATQSAVPHRAATP